MEALSMLKTSQAFSEANPQSNIKCPCALINGKPYNMSIEEIGMVPYVVISVPTGKKIYIHSEKSCREVKKGYVVNQDIADLIENYFRGELVLYRGVPADHPVFTQAVKGLAPAKTTATDDTPFFTSDSSTTKFIPFSSTLSISSDFSKTIAQALPAEMNLSDVVVGALLRIVVDTSHTIAIFDIGEIQVLDPPKAVPYQINGTTIIQGGLPLNDLPRNERDQMPDPINARDIENKVVQAQTLEARNLKVLPNTNMVEFEAPDILPKLKAITLSAHWRHCTASLTQIAPDGVLKMREEYKKENLIGVFRIAMKKHKEKSHTRYQITTEFYEVVAFLQENIQNIIAVRAEVSRRLTHIENALNSEAERMRKFNATSRHLY